MKTYGFPEDEYLKIYNSLNDDHKMIFEAWREIECLLENQGEPQAAVLVAGRITRMLRHQRNNGGSHPELGDKKEWKP